jgi:hypothetical protein
MERPPPPRIFSPDPARQAAAQSAVNTRHAIAMAYCEDMGWPTDPALLSMEQIMEIRSLPTWKAAR